MLDDENCFSINVEGTKNLLRIAEDLNVCAFVYTSTVNVVFGGQEIENGDESMDYFPLYDHVDPYSQIKEKKIFFLFGINLRISSFANYKANRSQRE